MKKTIQQIALITLVVLLFQSCKESKKSTKVSEENKEWSYSGETGPKYWNDLLIGSDCGGKKQSPININTNNTVELEMNLNFSDFHYTKTTKINSVTNNGHTIEYDFDSGNNTIVFEGKEYTLKQFHFHSPSEHKINGVQYPLEMHLVHYNKKTNDYLVFALMAEQGDSSPTFNFLEKFLPLAVNETKKVNSNYKFEEKMEKYKNSTFYFYEGSLTTPPCTEKVKWFILKEPLTVSEEQIKVLQNSMPIDNFRDIQPINERKIFKIKSKTK